MGGSQQSFKLNRDKTKESVFSARRKVALPPPRPDTERVSILRVLGVILSDKLTAADHVTALLSSGSSMLYHSCTRCECCARTARRPRRCKTTVISHILYAASSWSGMCSAVDHVRLDSCYVAANGWATAEATRRSSPNCSIPLTTTFSSASKQILTMSSSHIYRHSIPAPNPPSQHHSNK